MHLTNVRMDFELSQMLLFVNNAIFLVFQVLEFLLVQLVIPFMYSSVEVLSKTSCQSGLTQLIH